MQTVLLKPLVTEKSMHKAGEGKYTFIVARFARKQAIKEAIEKKFSVHIVSIMTSVVKGKTKRTGQKRIEVKNSPFKKATVGLLSGEKIGLFEVAA